ncbi:MAG: YqiJ family protein [Gammaproteobacteria bacterium]|nr:YqiJ family protein [Gammaproteobacteria bacterium]MBU2178249.1 YqiJ family protein [Gammaproteobacteria bacterium]MBU2225766.1 YqiJ family protein [Gammaproteobacteria bacterium]MBU2280738.1 YqiJ family protein [Gammaproteobacteria bacterium]MBU2425632.1 YqiJ family protein [Gammaproteobacteria bacterium]
MWSLLLATENKVFTVALILMLLIAVLEVVALFVGNSMSDALDSLLPETDLHAHTEIGHPDSDAALSRFLGWLRIGQVPLLMLLVLWLCNFGLIGLLLQALSRGIFGSYLPLLLSVPITIMLSLPLLRVSGGILHKVMPKDETTAVSEDSLIGRVAIITLGQARQGFPAEARVKDQHGYSHYIRLEPDNSDTHFEQGSEVLLLTRQGTVYQGILNPNKHLSDKP